MTHRDFIAIGTSSGGVDTLRTLVSRLPSDLQATIAIVLHVGAHDSFLPSLLSSAYRFMQYMQGTARPTCQAKSTWPRRIAI